MGKMSVGHASVKQSGRLEIIASGESGRAGRQVNGWENCLAITVTGLSAAGKANHRVSPAIMKNLGNWGG